MSNRRCRVCQAPASDDVCNNCSQEQDDCGWEQIVTQAEIHAPPRSPVPRQRRPPRPSRIPRPQMNRPLAPPSGQPNCCPRHQRAAAARRPPCPSRIPGPVRSQVSGQSPRCPCGPHGQGQGPGRPARSRIPVPAPRRCPSQERAQPRRVPSRSRNRCGCPPQAHRGSPMPSRIPVPTGRGAQGGGDTRRRGPRSVPICHDPQEREFLQLEQRCELQERYGECDDLAEFERLEQQCEEESGYSDVMRSANNIPQVRFPPEQYYRAYVQPPPLDTIYEEEDLEECIENYEGTSEEVSGEDTQWQTAQEFLDQDLCHDDSPCPPDPYEEDIRWQSADEYLDANVNYPNCPGPPQAQAAQRLFGQQAGRVTFRNSPCPPDPCDEEEDIQWRNANDFLDSNANYPISPRRPSPAMQRLYGEQAGRITFRNYPCPPDPREEDIQWQNNANEYLDANANYPNCPGPSSSRSQAAQRLFGAQGRNVNFRECNEDLDETCLDESFDDTFETCEDGYT